jgi:hypothetical protein
MEELCKEVQVEEFYMNLVSLLHNILEDTTFYTSSFLSSSQKLGLWEKLCVIYMIIALCVPLLLLLLRLFTSVFLSMHS